jgi:protein-disulfide isomerase
MVILASIVTIVAQWPTTKSGSALTWETPPPNQPVSIRTAPVLGSLKTPNVMIVYSDFECPFCARFARQVWPAIKKQLVETGRLRVAFRHLPLESIHVNAAKAAEGAACAQAAGRFWEYHDELFRLTSMAVPPRPDVPILLQSAVNISLDLGKFEACIAGEMRSRVVQEAAEARALGITSTPRFLLGRAEGDDIRVTQIIRGARPVEDFVAAVGRLESSRMPGPRADPVKDSLSPSGSERQAKFQRVRPQGLAR